MKQVKVNPNIDILLTEMSTKRKDEGHLNSTKQGIVAELIIEQHKKEMKKNES